MCPMLKHSKDTFGFMLEITCSGETYAQQKTNFVNMHV